MRKFFLPAVAALALVASASTGFSAEFVRAINDDGTVSLSSGRVVPLGSQSIGSNEYQRLQCQEAQANRDIAATAQFCNGTAPLFPQKMG